MVEKQLQITALASREVTGEKVCRQVFGNLSKSRLFVSSKAAAFFWPIPNIETFHNFQALLQQMTAE